MSGSTVRLRCFIEHAGCTKLRLLRQEHFSRNGACDAFVSWDEGGVRRLAFDGFRVQRCVTVARSVESVSA